MAVYNERNTVLYSRYCARVSRVSRVCPGSPGVFLLVLCVPAPPGGAVAITVTTTALAGVWCGVGRRVCPGVRVWSGA